MSSLTEREMAEIATLKREEGIQRLSGHFTWPELSGSQRRFHQQFMYDATLFAVAQGFPWSHVIRVANTTKELFPRLDGMDAAALLAMLRDTLCECLPCLAPVHQQQLILYLTDTCSARQRLLQAVVRGAANVSFTQGHLEGTEQREWELQQQEAHLTAALRQKEVALRSLRQGSEVTLEEEEEVRDGEDGQVDEEGLCELVRAAVRAHGAHIRDRLDKEASLVSELLEVKLQLTTLATRRLHQSTPSNTVPASPVQTHIRKRNGPLTKKKHG